MKRIAYSLGLDINDVVYLRRDGKVIGARYLGLESETQRGEITLLKFYRADGEVEVIKMYCGCLKDSTKSVYATIEDAIHEKPIKYIVNDITDFMKDYFGFTHATTCIGYCMLGKTVWKWDGYKPKKVHKWHTNYKIAYNGEWSCEYIGKDKYYDTEEECRRENHVDVMTF